jgi:TRAP-type C4-dicarboxylate transport system substrate-binding protein
MNLPYMFEGTQALRKVMDDPSIREEINRNLAKVNMRGLLFLDNGGPRNVQTNKGPVRVPADLKGQKIRTTSSPVEIAIFKNWGALTTPIAWPEVYTALSQGTVDGEGIQYTWMYSTRHYEVLKYVCENAYVIGTQNGLIRLDVWNRLPKDLQDLVTAAAGDAEAWEAKIDADFTSEAREKIIAAGVKVYRPTADELQQWKQAVAPRTWETFKDKVAPDFIKRIQALQKKA